MNDLNYDFFFCRFDKKLKNKYKLKTQNIPFYLHKNFFY